MSLTPENCEGNIDNLPHDKYVEKNKALYVFYTNEELLEMVKGNGIVFNRELTMKLRRDACRDRNLEWN